MQVRDKLYINGAWVAPHGKGSIDVHAAATEEVIARIPEGDAVDANAAVAAARTAFEAWSATPPADRAAFLAQDQRGHEGPVGRDRPHDRAGSRDAAQARDEDPGRLPDLHLRHVREDARRLQVGGEGRQLGGDAGAGGGGRVHHALELSAAPDRRQGRARACRRVHRGAEALRGRAAQRVHPRRDHRLGRGAEGRVQPRHRLRPGPRRGPRGSSRSRHGVVHRLDARGAARVRARRADGEARRARARRQERLDRARRRRSPGSGERDAQRLLPQLGPDVQRTYAAAGARVEVRGSGEARRRGSAEVHARRPAQGRRPARAARLRATARAGARLHPQGDRGRRRAPRRRAGRARGPRAGLLREARRCSAR